jgi:hypothetical protein
LADEPGKSNTGRRRRVICDAPIKAVEPFRQVVAKAGPTRVDRPLPMKLTDPAKLMPSSCYRHLPGATLLQLALTSISYFATTPSQVKLLS